MKSLKSYNHKILTKIILAVTACAVLLFASGCASEPKESKITISHTSVQISINESVTLTADSSVNKPIYWTSANEDIATVENGVVTGIAEGETSVVATDGISVAVCAVTVNSTVVKKLVWSDEFEGNGLDMSKWSYQVGIQDFYGSSTGSKYWGNDELQYYTEGDNLKVADGILQITAKRENMGDREYTSSRIVTRDKASWTYGYIEAKIKTPTGNGMWPAFWMLPQPSSQNNSDNVYGGWPANGELDIMEAKGRLLNKVDTTLHFGGPNWQIHDMDGKSTTLSSNTDEWHTYAVDWRADYIAWIIDGEEVHRVNSSRWWTSASNNTSAPFDQPFFILLNLAVGGQYDGYVSPAQNFTSATMYVDYVRVYE